MNQSYRTDNSLVFEYENFWSDFDPTNNFLTRLLQLDAEVAEETKSGLRAGEAIRIESHFLPQLSNFKTLYIAFKHFLSQSMKSINLSEKNRAIEAKEPSIFYTPENFRVPTKYRFSISHDLDSYTGHNLYYPYLFDHLLMAKLGQKDHLYGDFIEFSYLMNKRQLLTIPSFFASIFFSNDVPLRRRLIELMKKGGEVEVFGKVSGEYVSNRSVLAGQYKFVLCPENDHFPGYVTEKILHAYAMGAVPVYWGGLTLEQGLNPRAFIHLDPTSNLNSQISDIHSMSDERYKEIYEQPLFLQEPNWTRIRKTILDWIEILKREANEAK